MLLLIDNFDSFTYNLVQYFQVLNQQVSVLRSNASLTECQALAPSYLVISPGPGHPHQAGLSNEALAYYSAKIPILGVCLGHQCLARLNGANVIQARYPMHGKVSQIYHDGKGLFQGLPQGFSATRYHSLIVERDSIPSCLEISAETNEGEIMGLRHRDYPYLDGVQFHPESIMTQWGMELLKNFLVQSSLS